MFQIDQEKCQRVGDCAEACPVAAIETKDDGAFYVNDSCTDCGACEPACDNEAIQRVH